ncbi:lipase family protein [Xenorhabdus sp. IM139775]|uniref:lipase family protein n=1 Tax=Xenorhabdus sp. IM139775 TaxID=3025876 RepID=UPI0023583B1C|nr:lipase family protein [Xenorhabdus sp. IM139775]MDC9594398.1 lipase family protein [Xenorhabdus sp. IM139775]
MFTVNYFDSFAALVLYAATMYDQYPNDIMPPPDPRIEKDGWKLRAYISCNYYYTFMNTKTNKKELIFSDDRVNHGYIAERIENPGEYFVALRGTKTFEEALKDLNVGYIQPWPDTPEQSVFEGFYSVYKSLNLVVPDNTTGIDYSQLELADAITQLIGVASCCTISGHSLGAAVVTYLMRDIYNKAPYYRSCLFASPNVGNDEFVEYVSEHFKDYNVLNYINDLIPELPPNSEQLPNVITLYPRDDVIIDDSITCKHTILTYLALINKYKFFDVLDGDYPIDQATWNECLRVSLQEEMTK